MNANWHVRCPRGHEISLLRVQTEPITEEMSLATLYGAVAVQRRRKVQVGTRVMVECPECHLIGMYEHRGRKQPVKETIYNDGTPIKKKGDGQ
ncbi:MAG TPA: hypothetical protein VNL14_16495 [Candidatus Acidoferrales bacterium]|nr:hypothetical protein [Candidatus Acidoferrales bacterium]